MESNAQEPRLLSKIFRDMFSCLKTRDELLPISADEHATDNTPVPGAPCQVDDGVCRSPFWACIRQYQDDATLHQPSVAASPVLRKVVDEPVEFEPKFVARTAHSEHCSPSAALSTVFAPAAAAATQLWPGAVQSLPAGCDHNQVAGSQLERGALDHASTATLEDPQLHPHSRNSSRLQRQAVQHQGDTAPEGSNPASAVALAAAALLRSFSDVLLPSSDEISHTAMDVGDKAQGEEEAAERTGTSAMDRAYSSPEVPALSAIVNERARSSVLKLTPLSFLNRPRSILPPRPCNCANTPTAVSINRSSHAASAPLQAPQLQASAHLLDTHRVPTVPDAHDFSSVPYAGRLLASSMHTGFSNIVLQATPRSDTAVSHIPHSYSPLQSHRSEQMPGALAAEILHGQGLSQPRPSAPSRPSPAEASQMRLWRVGPDQRRRRLLLMAGLDPELPRSSSGNWASMPEAAASGSDPRTQHRDTTTACRVAGSSRNVATACKRGRVRYLCQTCGSEQMHTVQAEALDCKLVRTLQPSCAAASPFCQLAISSGMSSMQSHANTTTSDAAMPSGSISFWA